MSDHDHFIEPPTSTLHTRREFMRTSMLGAAAAWTLPVFLQKTFFELDAMAADSAIQTPTGKDAPILVVIQLAGGNDGLNTVVPYADDAYHAARPNLGLKPGAVLKVDGYLGLNPKLAGFKALYDEGHLALVQGVGYPNPNRSHFRSTEIWQAASDADKNDPYGWLGKYFDSCCKGEDPTVGVSIGGERPQAFASPNPTGVSFSRPEQYRWVHGKDAAGEDVFEQLNRPDENAGGSIGMIGAASAPEMGALDFLQRTALDARMSSDRILEISKKFRAEVEYPRTRLADSLHLVARMIAGGLPTRVYYVSQGGYDTHTNQAGTHDRLMGELNDAVSAFCGDMKKQGNFGRVMLMTFSEFGRRVAQNGSSGTDHGAAAPLFVVGGGVKPGVYGKHPSLTELKDGDLVFGTDFRSVYATVLERWMRAPSTKVLGRKFPLLPFA
jgi:uncharacterized protein (DUF1501 family)